MGKYKKAAAYLLTLVLCLQLSLTGGEMCRVKAQTSGDWDYEVNEDGTVTVTEYNGEENEVVIPAVLDGYKVTSIGEFAFSSSLTNISIPSSVTSIGWNAFYGCSSLKSISIPNSVTSIEGYAFWDCSSLKSISIPDSVTSIGRYAFRGTKWLDNKRAVNPCVVVNGILIDGYECKGIVNIPSSVTSIGGAHFLIVAD